MNVGIIGGTGGMGKGFAIRWCKDHNVVIGSRDAERASTSAKEYSWMRSNNLIIISIEDKFVTQHDNFP